MNITPEDFIKLIRDNVPAIDDMHTVKVTPEVFREFIKSSENVTHLLVERDGSESTKELKTHDFLQKLSNDELENLIQIYAKKNTLLNATKK